MAQAKAREKPTGVATNAILAWDERSMVTQWIERSSLQKSVCTFHTVQKSLQGNSRKLKISLAITVAHTCRLQWRNLIKKKGAFYVHLIKKKILDKKKLEI